MSSNKEISDLMRDDRVYGYEPTAEDLEAYEEIYEKAILDEFVREWVIVDVVEDDFDNLNR